MEIAVPSSSSSSSRCLAVLAAVVCLVAPVAARSPQSPSSVPPPSASPPADAMPEAAPPVMMRDEGATVPATADPLADREPYKRWKNHDGAPTDSVVLIRTSGGAAFSGVVVRCDGFLLVPQEVYAYVDDRDVKVEAAVTATATEKGDEPRCALPVSGRLHTGANYRAGYGLIKVNDHHLRALRPLSAATLKPGTPLRVVWAVPDPRDRSRCLAAVRDAIVGENLPDDGGQLWRIEGLKAPAPGDDAAGTPVIPPLGAAVIDAESGGLVGMVTRPGGEGAASPVFSSLLRMGDSINEVGIAPSRTALKRSRDPKGPPRIDGRDPGTGRWREGEMVRIPGGPVLLPGALGAELRKAYGTDVVCTPDFYIDVYPTSIKEYRGWLSKRPNVQAPRGWKSDELRYPERRQDLPVTGVRSVEAAAYAADQDARLPTQVEWLRASRLSASAVGRVEAEIRSVTEIRARLGMVQAKASSLGEILRELASDATGAKASVGGVIARERLPASAREFYDGLRELLAHIRQYAGTGTSSDWLHLPGMINPLDAEDADVSVYGVRHIAMNAPEMVVSRGFTVSYAPKVLAAWMDPYVARGNASWDFNIMGTLYALAPNDSISLSGRVDKRIIDLTAEDDLAWAGLFGTLSVEARAIYARGYVLPSRQASLARAAGAIAQFHLFSKARPEVGLSFRRAR